MCRISGLYCTCTAPGNLTFCPVEEREGRREGGKGGKKGGREGVCMGSKQCVILQLYSQQLVNQQWAHLSGSLSRLLWTKGSDNRGYNILTSLSLTDHANIRRVGTVGGTHRSRGGALQQVCLISTTD